MAVSASEARELMPVVSKNFNAVAGLSAAVTRRVQLLKAWAVFELWTKITLRTPVRTGRARASWNIGVGEPDGTVPAESEQVPFPLAPPLQDMPIGVPVYVTSNLSYIRALEEGHSKQAPAGMVRLSLIEVQAALASSGNASPLQLSGFKLGSGD